MLTEPWRDVVLQRVPSVRLQATLAASRLDVILAPTWPTGAAAVLGVSVTPAASSGVRCLRSRRIPAADCRRYGRAIVADLRVVARVCRPATAWCLFSATLADTMIVARSLRYAFLARIRVGFEHDANGDAEGGMTNGVVRQPIPP